MGNQPSSSSRKDPSPTLRNAKKLRDLAQASTSEGDVESAIRYHKNSLNLAVNSHGKYHEDVAFLCNEISSLYCQQRKYDEALLFLQKALDIGMQTCEKGSPTIKSIWKNIGMVFKAKGQFPDALVCFNKVLDLSRGNFVETVDSLKEISEIHREQGYSEEALQSLKEALDLASQQGFGESAIIGEILNIIGHIYQEKQEFVAAFKYYYKALRIKKIEVGERHEAIVGSYINVGSILKDCQEYDEAIDYYTQALEIYIKSAAPDKGSICELYNQIGSLHAHGGSFAESLHCFRKAVGFCSQQLGESHPIMAELYDGMGSAYCSFNNLKATLECWCKALEIRLKTFGNEHPMVATSYHNIGTAYQKLDRKETALSYFRKALKIRQAKLGEFHLCLGDSYWAVGQLMIECDDESPAGDYLEECLKIYTKRFGKDHEMVQKVIEMMDSVIDQGISTKTSSLEKIDE